MMVAHYLFPKMKGRHNEISMISCSTIGLAVHSYEVHKVKKNYYTSFIQYILIFYRNIFKREFRTILLNLMRDILKRYPVDVFTGYEKPSNPSVMETHNDAS